jgi:hypothetical protein
MFEPLVELLFGKLLTINPPFFLASTPFNSRAILTVPFAIDRPFFDGAVKMTLTQKT